MRNVGFLEFPPQEKEKNENENENEIENEKKEKNKAGYTANTSRGRVGRGGNARFHTFRLVFTDRPTDGRTDGQSLL